MFLFVRGVSQTKDGEIHIFQKRKSVVELRKIRRRHRQT